LIVTAITEMGILQVSDSNLTSVVDYRTSTGKKVFQLGFCPGALALSGSYSVGSARMDSWMPSAIETYAATTAPTLGDFAQYLRDRLTEEGQGKVDLLIHIAGYAGDGGGTHPEMWFVRNFGGIDEVTGDYLDRADDFKISEDFWARDYAAAREAGRQPGGPFRQWYFNGFPSGRISYNVLRQLLLGFFNLVWNHQDWRFRPPTTLEELALFMRLELNVVATLFNVSDYPAPFVGGEAQVEAVPAPADSAAL
jgi:hypothetical protein